MPGIQPQSERRSKQCGSDDGPANEPHHTESEPDVGRRFPGLQFALNFGLDLSAKFALTLPPDAGFLTHDEILRNGVRIRFPALS